MPKRFYAYFLILTIGVLAITGITDYTSRQQIEQSRQNTASQITQTVNLTKLQAKFYQDAINHQLAQLDTQSAEYAEMFESQASTLLVQREVAIAQEYANNLASLADLSAHRAHELDEKLERAKQDYIALFEQSLQKQAIATFTQKLTESYIKQLLAYIQENDLPIPMPNPHAWGGVPSNFHIDVQPLLDLEVPDEKQDDTPILEDDPLMLDDAPILDDNRA